MPIRLIAALCCVVGFFTGATAIAADKTVDFNHDVRHIFSNHCYACHGPDGAKRKAGLRLDLKDAQRSRSSSPATSLSLVPGDLKKSALWERVSAATGRKADASAGQASANRCRPRRSIRSSGCGSEAKASVGRPLGLRRAEAAAAAGSQEQVVAARHDMETISSLSRLEKEGLQAVAGGRQGRSCVRVSFDLTGLPPTPAELDAFVAESSPDAYEKVVGRLLASPAYGEPHGGAVARPRPLRRHQRLSH